MDKKNSLNEIKVEINLLAAQIGASDDLLPTYGYTVDGAHPHIEVDSRGYHYVVVERGEKINRITTDEFDELLYNVFEHVTFELACKYGSKHRVAHQDFRRLLFQHQIELLSMLSPEWSEIESQEHERIRQGHPYNDAE